MLPKTYDEFKELLADTLQLTDLGEPLLTGRRNEYPSGDHRLIRSWTTGGMQGGNCWGGSPDYSVESEPEPDDKFLDEILELVVPNLTFLQYRKLERNNLYDKYDASYTEYYGNYTDREGRRLSIERLYNALKEIVGEN